MLEQANKHSKRSNKADGSWPLVPGPKRRKARENKVFAYLPNLKGGKNLHHRGTQTLSGSDFFFCKQNGSGRCGTQKIYRGVFTRLLVISGKNPSEDGLRTEGTD